MLIIKTKRANGLIQTILFIIVSYWATWCKPCIQELPDFIKLDEELQNKKVKFILVSLDFANNVDSIVKPFVQNRNISIEVVVLNDNENIWIDKVDSNWDGAIPATLL